VAYERLEPFNEKGLLKDQLTKVKTVQPSAALTYQDRIDDAVHSFIVI
jgi:hypothetical protein